MYAFSGIWTCELPHRSKDNPAPKTNRSRWLRYKKTWLVACTIREIQCTYSDVWDDTNNAIVDTLPSLVGFMDQRVSFLRGLPLQDNDLIYIFTYNECFSSLIFVHFFSVEIWIITWIPFKDMFFFKWVNFIPIQITWHPKWGTFLNWPSNELLNPSTINLCLKTRREKTPKCALLRGDLYTRVPFAG